MFVKVFIIYIMEVMYMRKCYSDQMVYEFVYFNVMKGNMGIDWYFVLQFKVRNGFMGFG